MKICLIVDDYMPHSIKVGAKMMHELSVEFVALGHEVTVITPATGLYCISEVVEIDNVKVCRFHSGEIKDVCKVKRAINESLLSAHRKGLEESSVVLFKIVELSTLEFIANLRRLIRLNSPLPSVVLYF